MSCYKGVCIKFRVPRRTIAGQVPNREGVNFVQPNFVHHPFFPVGGGGRTTFFQSPAPQVSGSSVNASAGVMNLQDCAMKLSGFGDEMY